MERWPTFLLEPNQKEGVVREDRDELDGQGTTFQSRLMKHVSFALGVNALEKAYLVSRHDLCLKIPMHGGQMPCITIPNMDVENMCPPCQRKVHLSYPTNPEVPLTSFQAPNASERSREIAYIGSHFNEDRAMVKVRKKIKFSLGYIKASRTNILTSIRIVRTPIST